MKPQVNGTVLTAPQIALLQSGRFMMAELYTFTLVTGSVDHFTGLDVDVKFASNVYKSNSLRIDGLHFKLGIGTNVDEQTMKISAYPGETLAGGDFFTSVLDGALDGGYVARDRAFWSPATGIPAVDFQNPPDFAVRLFYGRVSDVVTGGRTHVELKVKSPLVLLSIDMPHNYYTPSCTHTLFDSGCTLSKGAFGRGGTVGVSPAPSGLAFAWNGGVSPVTGGDGLNHYAQGRVAFLTGPNENVQVTVRDNDASILYLQHPLSIPPNVGDLFVAYAGCSHKLTTCDLKFGNKAHFRGFPRIPPVYTGV